VKYTGFARLKGEINFNQLDDVNKYLDPAESKNMKHVSIDEFPRLLQAIDSYPTTDIRIGLKLLAILFPRPSELREAKWENVDLKKRVWIKPTTKTGIIHGVPLPHQAVALFEELKQYSSDSEYLFPSRINKAQPRSDTVFIMALRRSGYGQKQITASSYHATDMQTLDLTSLTHHLTPCLYVTFVISPFQK